MKNIFLVGYMGVGKTTIGKKLANRLMLEFVDLDGFISKKEGVNITDLINQNGESYFRNLEKKYLRELVTQDNLLISTGGGTPCFFDNMEVICRNGTSIYLRMDEKSVVNRLINHTESRPLIAGKNREELALFVSEHLKDRIPFYQKADLEFDVLNVNATRLDEWVNQINQSK